MLGEDVFDEDEEYDAGERLQLTRLPDDVKHQVEDEGDNKGWVHEPAAR